MADVEGAQHPEAMMDRAAAEASPSLIEEIAALEARRSKVLDKTSFNLQRGLEGGIPAGTFFFFGGLLFLVWNVLRHGLAWGYVLGALLFCVVGLLLYLLSCWSRWKAVEKRRVAALAVLDRQIEEKREELRRHHESAAG